MEHYYIVKSNRVLAIGSTLRKFVDTSVEANVIKECNKPKNK